MEVKKAATARIAVMVNMLSFIDGLGRQAKLGLVFSKGSSMQNQIITQKGYRNATNVTDHKQSSPLTKSQDNFKIHGKAPSHILKGERWPYSYMYRWRSKTRVLVSRVPARVWIVSVSQAAPVVDANRIDPCNVLPLEVRIIAQFEGDDEQRTLSPNAAIGCVVRCSFLLSGYFHMHS